MSVAGFLTDQASTGRTLSIGPSTGLGEAAGAAFDYAWRTSRSDAAMQYVGRPVNHRNDLLKQRTGKDVWDITGNREKRDTFAADPIHMQGALRALEHQNNEDLDNFILKGRAEEPEKYNGIRTTAEIREEARKAADISENHMNEIMIRNPSVLSRMTGGVVGGMGAVMLDSPNLLTLPLGAGPVKPGLKGFNFARATMKAAAVDGIINAGVEAATQPAIAAWQNELGRRYGFGDAAENVALGFVGGAALSGIIRGAGAAVKRGADYMGSVSADVLDRIASSPGLPASIRDAAAFLSRQAYVDENAPPGAIVTGEDLQSHRSQAQGLVEEFENYAAGSNRIAPSFAASSAGKSEASPPNGNVGVTSGAGFQPLPSQRTGDSPFSPRSKAYISPSREKALYTVGDIDSTSNSIIYHDTDKIDKLLKKAGALLPEVNRLTEEISSSIQGLKAYPGRVKEKASLEEKIAIKKRGPHTMPDIIGGRMVADSPAAIRAAVERLKSSARIIEIDDKMGSNKGYRAVHVIIASDEKGVSAEIQIQPREIREVQDEAHEKYYKKWNEYKKQPDMYEAIEKAGRTEEYLADLAAQDDLFADAWTRWEARTGRQADDFSDMVPPERMGAILEMPEGMTPETSPDRLTSTLNDLKILLKQSGPNDEDFAASTERDLSKIDENYGSVTSRAGYRVQATAHHGYRLSAWGDADFPTKKNLTREEVAAEMIAMEKADIASRKFSDEMIALDDGRVISLADYAAEIDGKRAMIEAMKTCRIA